MNRRTFVKQTCAGCVGVLAFSAIGALSGCSTLPVYKTVLVDRKVRVPKTSFLAGETKKLVRVSELDYDVLLVLGKEGQHQALLMRCTHIENPLIASSSNVICTMHGSQFNFSGDVTQGPAIRPLTKYHVREEQDDFIIDLNGS